MSTPPVLGWARFVRRNCFKEQCVFPRSLIRAAKPFSETTLKRGKERESGGASVLTDFKNKP